MTELRQYTGLEIQFDPESNELVFSDPSLTKVIPQYRTLSELQEYLKEEFLAGTAKDTAYLIYRHIAHKDDVELFKNSNIRYDITIIPEKKVGHEYIKTAGHYHPFKPGTSAIYPEILEIISGHGYFVIQKKDKDDDGLLREVYLVEAMPGEKVVLLPGFGHCSINGFGESLIFSNLIGDNFSYDYESFRKRHGAGYWLLQGSIPDTVDIVKNTYYKGVPEIKKLRPKELPKLGLIKKQPLYRTFINNPDIFRYLTEPENFTKDLTVEKCFKVIR